MKKYIIPGAGAVIGITTLIGAGGALAADGTLTQTDTVKVTIDSNCSLASSGSGLSPASTYERNIANGAFDTNITGSTFTITCNDTGGWKLMAVGYTNEIQGTTYMDASTGAASDDIPTGTVLNGSVSNWAAQFNKGGDDASKVTVDYANQEFGVIPANPTMIAHGSSTAGKATVTATYGVGISPTQSAGTYTGKVLYTLAHPIGEENVSEPDNNETGDNTEDGDNSETEGNSETGGNSESGEEPANNSGNSESENGGSENGGGLETPGNGANNSNNSLKPTSLQNVDNSVNTNSYTTNNVSNYYSSAPAVAPMSVAGYGSNGAGTSGTSGTQFASADSTDSSDANTDVKDKTGDADDEDDTYEAPLGVVSSSEDSESNGSGMETGFLVALGAAAVAGVATYALIRKEDSEEE